jgi:signal transduction histidine kinase
LLAAHTLTTQITTGSSVERRRAALWRLSHMIAGRRRKTAATKDAGTPLGRRRGRWSLRAYLLGLIALFVVAMAAGTVYVGLEAHATARQSAEANTTFAAQAAAKEISGDLTQLQSAVAGLASTPGIAKLFGAASGCSLSFAGAGAFSTGHLDIIDTDGSVACSSKAGAHSAAYAAAPWLPTALRGPVLVAPFRDPVSAGQVVVSAAPVPGGRGVVAGFLDLEPVAPALTSTFGGASHLEFMVTSSDGSVALARSIDPARWTGRPLAGTPFATGAAQTERKDVDGMSRLYGAATASTPGWHVYAGEDTATALASARSLANHDVVILAGAAIVFVVAVFVVYRRTVRPIARLEARITSASSDRAFDPIPVEGPTEVAALASSFNSLMAAVDAELTRRQETEERLSESLARLESVDSQRRRLLDKIVTAQEEERRRIASDVHDDSVQVMAAALMRLSLIRQQDLDPDVDRQLAKLQETTEKAIERLRHLLFQLCPPSLDREGLATALTEYLEQWTAEANLAYRIDDRLSFEPPLHIRAQLFRIAQEALTNVRKHAHANSVTLTLESGSGGVMLRIEDDGVGMAAADLGPAPIGHLGLATMRERAELAGGWCRIEGASSAGTTVEAWIPVSQGAMAVA